MLLKVIFFVCGISFTSLVVGQKKVAYQNFPDSSDSREYLDLLFKKNASTNFPYTIVKVQIEEHSCFLITSKTEVKNYFKEKYKVSDSIAEMNEYLFLKNKTKIPFSDTVFFSKNMQLGRRAVYHDSLLYKYRKLDFINFLNKYLPVPHFEQTIYLLAFMFEKSMLYDWNNECLDFRTASLLGTKYHIQYDVHKKKWQLNNRLVSKKAKGTF